MSSDATEDKARRARGTGHLYTRRDKAGRESWFAKFYVDGRQVKRKVGPKRDQNGRGLDRAEAERKLRGLVDDVAPPVHSRVDLEEAGRYLIEHRRALGRKPATIEAYDSLLRIHLAPFFAGRSLDAITADDIEQFIRAKSREGKSIKTITNALGLLHSIFAYGQRRGWAKANPCQLVEKPRADTDADIRFLDAEELEAAIRAEAEVGDDLAATLALMYRAAAMTGLRQGELIGLRWRDVDWIAAKVRVRRSYVRGESPHRSRGGALARFPLPTSLQPRSIATIRPRPTEVTATSCSLTRRSASRSTARRCASASRRRSPAQASGSSRRS